MFIYNVERALKWVYFEANKLQFKLNQLQSIFIA